MLTLNRFESLSPSKNDFVNRLTEPPKNTWPCHALIPIYVSKWKSRESKINIRPGLLLRVSDSLQLKVSISKVPPMCCLNQHMRICNHPYTWQHGKLSNHATQMKSLYSVQLKRLRGPFLALSAADSDHLLHWMRRIWPTKRLGEYSAMPSQPRRDSMIPEFISRKECLAQREKYVFPLFFCDRALEWDSVQ